MGCSIPNSAKFFLGGSLVTARGLGQALAAFMLNGIALPEFWSMFSLHMLGAIPSNLVTTTTSDIALSP